MRSNVPFASRVGLAYAIWRELFWNLIEDGTRRRRR